MLSLASLSDAYGFLVASILQWGEEQFKIGNQFINPSDLVHQYYLELLPPSDLANSHELQEELVRRIKSLINQAQKET